MNEHIEENKKVIEKIKENYNNINNIICGELNLSSAHNGLSGSCREDFWTNFFRGIIPQKFAMEKGVIIIDSFGNRSKEVDIAIIDNQYTPYVFNYGNLKFIPIEAVAIVIECKSSEWNKNSVIEWSKTINKLESVSAGIVRIVQGNAISATTISQKQTTPIKILASMRKNPKNSTIKDIEENFDFILNYNSDGNGKFELEYKVPNESKKLGWWAEKLNNHKTTDEINEIEDKGIEITIRSDESKKLETYKSVKSDESKKLETYVDKYFSEKERKKRNEDSSFHNGMLKIESTLADLKIENNILLSFNFQINQLLMLINNPMPFPHFAYAKLFKG